jgi:phage shock protein A
MWKSLKRWWHYVAMKLRVAHDEHADPKVQLEQAIAEARDQHRRLTEQAANVIANQQQTQARLDRAIQEYEKTKASAGQALVLGDRQHRSGNDAKAASFDTAAEALASRLLDLEREIAELQTAVLQATTAADGAKTAVARNSTALQTKLQEKQRLLSDLDRAKMQEQMNRATAQLSATLGDDVPTFAEVEQKIQVRLARANASAELTAAQVESPADASILEVESAVRSSRAQARLDQMRSSLGLPAVDEQPALQTPPPRVDERES